MLTLGFETSCDETACAIVRDGRHVLSNAIATQTELHEGYGGVVPEIAGRAHVERIIPVLRKAVDDAEVSLADINAVAVGHRPGLIGSLLVGVCAAKAAAFTLGAPLVGVDHVQAHLIAGTLDIDEDPPMPALGLVVSGGHTAIYLVRSATEAERLGTTRDDAIGEAYDKAATILGLPYPGGPRLDALAQEPGADDHAHEFPISRLERGSLDFSFSGLKTAVLYAVRGVPTRPGAPVQPPPPPPLTEARKRDLAASFQRAAVRAVTLKLGRALDSLAEHGIECKSLLAGGGVPANSRLRSELSTLAQERGLELRLPKMAYCLDNAAMIAALGARRVMAGHTDELSLRAHPSTMISQSDIGTALP